MSILKLAEILPLVFVALACLIETGDAYFQTRIGHFEQVRNQPLIRLRMLWRLWSVADAAAYFSLLFCITTPAIIITQFGRFSLHHPPAFFMATAFAGGLLAFIYKRATLFWYGITEVVFGTASALSITERTSIQAAILAKWTVMVGSIYVVSRGCGNVAEAANKSGLLFGTSHRVNQAQMLRTLGS